MPQRSCRNSVMPETGSVSRQTQTGSLFFFVDSDSLDLQLHERELLYSMVRFSTSELASPSKTPQDTTPVLTLDLIQDSLYNQPRLSTLPTC
jgi:hypothetical protein